MYFNCLVLSFCMLFAAISNATSYVNVTREPTEPHAAPTMRPSAFPTTEPTDYPVVSGVGDAEDTVIVITATVPVTRREIADVIDETVYFEALFGDAGGLDINEVDIRVDSIQKVASYPACNTSGVNINYEIISDDSNTYTSIRQNVDSGSFKTTYDIGLANVYDSNTYICIVNENTTIVESFTIEAYDDVYPPTPAPTLAEDLWSEYLFFGLFTSLIGVVWLYYLRSDVDDDNIYVSNEKQTKMEAKNTSVDGGGASGAVQMASTVGGQGNSSNPLLDDDASKGKLSDYAVKSDDGKLVLDQRDSDRKP